jgi:glucose-1-phosphate thymidylyltransferase
MKGVILAGGMGTRLAPMTKVTNKHLLPVSNFPMIYYPVYSLSEAGIEDIIIITGGNSPGDFLELLHDGHEFGLNTLYYAYQHAPQGIADALRLAEAFVDGDDCVVMLGDNIMDGSLSSLLGDFNGGAKVILSKVEDPERFGVPVLSGSRITEIIEKPTNPPSNYAVVGIYLFDSQVWDILPTLELSERGQYEVTDILNCYIEDNQLGYEVYDCQWSDAGTTDSLFVASQIVRESKFFPQNLTARGN